MPIGFWYYLNVVSLCTHSSTLGKCWFARDLWFVSDHSKHQSSPSPTTGPLCKVQYRDPCSFPSWCLVVSTSLYFQFILCGKKSKGEDFCQCSYGTRGHDDILAWWMKRVLTRRVSTSCWKQQGRNSVYLLGFWSSVSDPRENIIELKSCLHNCFIVIKIHKLTELGYKQFMKIKR